MADLSWEGLCCPPLDDYAFNFDSFDCLKLAADDIFDDPRLLEEDDKINQNSRTDSTKEDDQSGSCCNKSNVVDHRFGKGKELRTLIRVLKPTQEQIKGLNYVRADQETKQDKKRTTCDYQPMEAATKNRTRVTNEVGAVPKKPPAILHGARDEAKQDQKIKSCDFQPAQTTILDRENEVGNIKKRKAEYESRMEATKRRLQESYAQIKEAKNQRKIQVIDFQKPVVKLPKSKAKTSTRKSIVQKLTAMKAHNRCKKFRPLVCN